MTKRADTPPPDEEPVLEMDALHEAEWEQDQHTPIVEDEKLAALVKESGPRAAGSTPAIGRTTTQSGARTNVVKRAATSAGVVPADAPRMKTPPPTPTKLPPPAPSAGAKPRADATGSGAKANTVARTSTKSDLASAAKAASDGTVASAASAKADASAKSKSPTAFLMNASAAPREVAADIPSSPIASVLGAVSAKPVETSSGGRRRRETADALAAARAVRAPAPTPDSALPIARDPSELSLRSSVDAKSGAAQPTKSTRTMPAVEKTPTPTKTTNSTLPAVEKTPAPVKTTSTMAAVEKTPTPIKTTSTMAAVEKTPTPIKTTTMPAVEKTPAPTKQTRTMPAVEKTPPPTRTTGTLSAVEKTPPPTKTTSTLAAVEKTPPPTKLPLPAPGVGARAVTPDVVASETASVIPQAPVLATRIPTDDGSPAVSARGTSASDAIAARGTSSTGAFGETNTSVETLPPPPAGDGTSSAESDWDSAATSTMVSPHHGAPVSDPAAPAPAATATGPALGLPAWPPPQASPPATAITGPSHPPIAATPVGAAASGSAFGAAPSPYPSAAPYLPSSAPLPPPIEVGTARADASWSRAPGTAADEDNAPLVPGRSLRDAVVAFTRSPKKLAIAGGALLFVIVVFVFAFSGGKKTGTTSGSQTVASAPAKSKAKAKPNAADHATAAPAADTAAETADEPSEPSTDSPTQRSPAIAASTGTAATTTSETPSASADPGTASAAPDATAPPAQTSATTPPTAAPIEGKPAVARPVAKKIGGKRVVLEYDSQARDATKPAPTAAPADQTAVAKARASYNTGNQRLFAGDTNGAIRLYKQSLWQYPGYVAGYRGLGLAYMQAGDKANALQALRTYIGSVPNAKDAPLIRKRIATLQAR